MRGRSLSTSPPAERMGGGRQPRLQLPSPRNFISRIVNGARPRSDDNLLILSANAAPAFFGSPTSSTAVRKSRTELIVRAPASPARCVSSSTETPLGLPSSRRDDVVISRDKSAAEHLFASPFAFRQCKHCAGLCYTPRDFGAGVFCSGECAACFAIMARDPATIPRITSIRDHEHSARRLESLSFEGWHGVGSHESNERVNPSEKGSPRHAHYGRGSPAQTVDVCR